MRLLAVRTRARRVGRGVGGFIPLLPGADEQECTEAEQADENDAADNTSDNRADREFRTALILRTCVRRSGSRSVGWTVVNRVRCLCNGATPEDRARKALFSVDMPYAVWICGLAAAIILDVLQATKSLILGNTYHQRVRPLSVVNLADCDIA